MFGRSVHRGVAALALTAALMVATARPAAAAEAPSLWGQVWQWMSSLVWSQVLSGDFPTVTTGSGEGRTRVAAGIEEGYEIDPNGFNSRSLSSTPRHPGLEPGTTAGDPQEQ